MSIRDDYGWVGESSPPTTTHHPHTQKKRKRSVKGDLVDGPNIYDLVILQLYGQFFPKVVLSTHEVPAFFLLLHLRLSVSPLF